MMLTMKSESLFSGFADANQPIGLIVEKKYRGYRPSNLPVQSSFHVVGQLVNRYRSLQLQRLPIQALTKVSLSIYSITIPNHTG